MACRPMLFRCLFTGLVSIGSESQTCYERAPFWANTWQHNTYRSLLRVCSSRNSSRQAFIGFITARYIKLHDCDPTDRAALGLSSRLLDAQEASFLSLLIYLCWWSQPEEQIGPAEQACFQRDCNGHTGSRHCITLLSLAC